MLSVPSAPTDLSIQNLGRTHQLTLSWTASSGATSYTVKARRDAGRFITFGTIASGLTSPNYVDTGLLEDAGYDFRVSADGSSSFASGSGTTGTFQQFDDINWDSQSASTGVSSLEGAGFNDIYPGLAGSGKNFNISEFLSFSDNAASVSTDGATYAHDLAVNAASEGKDIILDYEGVDGSYFDPVGNPDGTNSFIAATIQVLHIIKANDTSTHLSVYGLPMTPDGPFSTFVSLNSYFLTHVDSATGETLLQNVDSLPLNAYTASLNIGNYAADTMQKIQWLSSFGKPVYGFIKPYFDAEFTQTADLPNAFIGETYWKQMLDTYRGASDGVVIWSDLHFNWNADAPWWQVSQNYESETIGTAPTGPSDLSVSTDAALSWTNNDSPSATLIYIERETSGDSGYSTVAAVPASETTWTDPDPHINTNAVGLPPIESTYCVVAGNAWGVSPTTGDDNSYVQAVAARSAAVTSAADKFDTGGNNGLNDWLGGLNQFYPGRWAKYTLHFDSDATQFLASLAADSSYDLDIWVDPMMVDNEPTMGTGSQHYQINTEETSPYSETDPNNFYRHEFQESWDLADSELDGSSGTISAGNHVIYLAKGGTSNNYAWLHTFSFGGNTTGPAQPRELTADSIGENVHLQWQDFATNETGYLIQASTEGDTFGTIETLESGDLSSASGGTYTKYQYTVPITSGDHEVYTYRVIATRDDNLGQSMPSNVDQGSGDARPTGYLEAENYDNSPLFNLSADSGVNNASGGAWVQWYGVGDVLRYRDVDFGTDANHAVFDISGNGLDGDGHTSDGDVFDIYIDGDKSDRLGASYDDGGTLIGTLTAENLQYFYQVGTQSIPILCTSGVHDVYIKSVSATGGDGVLFDRMRFDSAPVTVTGSTGNDTVTITNQTSDEVIDEADGVTPYLTHRYTIDAADPDGIVIETAGGTDSVTWPAAATGLSSISNVAFAGMGEYDIAGNFDGADVSASSGAMVVVNQTQLLGSLSIGLGGRFVVAQNGSDVLELDALDIDSGGTLDLNDNDMVLHADPLLSADEATVEALLVSARNGGFWNGSGITSSTASSNSLHNTTLGLLNASDYVGYQSTSLFDGVTVAGNDVLVKYTYYGDANFSGHIDANDYNIQSVGYELGRSGWSNGDCDMSGVINANDFNLIDIAYETQGSVYL